MSGIRAQTSDWEVLSEMMLGAMLKALRSCPIHPRCCMEAGVGGDAPGVKAACGSLRVACLLRDALQMHGQPIEAVLHANCRSLLEEAVSVERIRDKAPGARHAKCCLSERVQCSQMEVIMLNSYQDIAAFSLHEREC